MTKRTKLAGTFAAVAMAASVVALATFAGATDEGPEQAVFARDLHGRALIDELGLPEVPFEGSNENVDCDWATEWEGKAYCLDSVASDWSSARLVGAQIRGTEITPELQQAMNLYDVMHSAQEALAEAQAEGASDEVLLELGQEVEAGRQAYQEFVNNNLPDNG